MMRLSVVLILVGCVFIPASMTFAQDDFAGPGGTVRGQIVDTTEMQNPIEGVEVKIVAVDGKEYTAITDANGDYERSGIPAGRYRISIYRDGYGDRLGKPVTVVDGGDHYLPFKMTNSIAIFFQGSVPMYWVLILLVIIVILIFARTNRS